MKNESGKAKPRSSSSEASGIEKMFSHSLLIRGQFYMDLANL